MSDRLQRIFRRLPGPARSMVAGIHGRRLRRWRYGPDTDRLISDALAREQWSEDRWLSWQQRRTTDLLERAREAPHYRNLHLSDGLALGDWPLLDKQDLRDRPEDFLVEGTDPSSMYEEHTSGSTGTPLTLWWSQQTVRAWYALFEARSRRWHGVSRHEPWAILGGQLVVRSQQANPPFWVWNSGLHQLYLSSYHVAPANAGAYADAMERRQVTHLVGYPSALAALARFLADEGRQVAGLRAVIGNAEPVSAMQREIITEVFGAPVQETYGMAELAVAASECHAGRRHVWPEVGLVETVGEELVATGLLNQDMPLVRYRTGDRLARVPMWDHGCPCGRTLPVIDAVDGRVDDVVVTPDGRTLGRLDPVFKSDLAIVEAQIVQDRIDHLRILVVPAEGFDRTTAEALEQRVLDHVGAMIVDVELTDRIPRGPGGKLRGVRSLIDGGRS